jgi:hypothetical protein
LLARDATLVLWFERWRTGWHCRMRLGVGRLPKVTAVAPVGQGDDANQPMFTAVLPSFYPWSDAACVPKHTTTWNAVFQVWRDVRPSIAVRITFDRLRVNYNPPLTASGSLELLPGSGGDTALVSILRFAPADVMILDKPFSVTADKKISVEVGAMSATFTVARGNSDYLVLRGPGSLTVSERSLRRANHGRMSQTSFRGDPTSVLRFSDPNELHHFSWSAEWRLAADAEQRIDTPHGRFNVVGGDRTKVTAAGTQKGAQSFSARALLRHAGLRLPLVEGKQHYAEVGRLDFDTGADSEIAFTLARLNGSAEPATSWIALDQNDDRRGELRLDHARLFVVREADMFWGCFRFKGVLLRLCGDGHCLIADPSQSDRLLRVDLPPQHVIETSFARQLPLLPGPNLDAAQLADARDEKKRKCLKKKLAANDKDFGEFSDRYALRYQEAVKKFKDDKKSAEQDKAGDELKKFNRAIKPPSDTIQKLEVVYIGESGLISLFGRRIADLVAFERRQSSWGRASTTCR